METLKLIGNTPMYHIKDTNIHVKLEKFNVGGSIKDRAVLGMLRSAMEKGMITKDTVLIEATSGNTGIALAMLGAVYKIPVIIIMPESMSAERRALIKAYGADLRLSAASGGMKAALEMMESLMKEHPEYVSLQQFENPANADIHYDTTGKEILAQVPDIDIFVAAVGTGGTFTGIARRLKEHDPHIRCIAGEPLKSSVISGHEAGAHRIQGIGAGFVPSILDRDLMDDIMMIDDEEAIRETVQFTRETGILVGISSGANLVLAKRLAHYYPDSTIVTIAPDGGEKYLSVLPFEEKL